MDLKKSIPVSSSEMAALQKKIRIFLEDGVPIKHRQISSYQVLNGGKQIRPILTILMAKLLGGSFGMILPAAAGIEVLHNYTLVIDDIIDRSTTRRGQKTTWAKFGSSYTLSALMNYSGALLDSASQSPEAGKIASVLANALKVVSQGEIDDILMETIPRLEPYEKIVGRPTQVSKKMYLQMIDRKTASLFEACSEAAAVVTRATRSQRLKVNKYAKNFGRSFQVADDVLDVFGDSNFGKKIGKDLEEGKRGNIVVLFALESLKKKDASKLLAILKNPSLTTSEINDGISLIRTTDARQRAIRMGQEFVKLAKGSLKTFPSGPYKRALEDLGDFSIFRDR